VGSALAPQRDPRHRRGTVHRRDRPVQTAERAFDGPTSTARDTTMEKAARMKGAATEIREEGFASRRENACGSNDGAAAIVVAATRWP